MAVFNEGKNTMNDGEDIIVMSKKQTGDGQVTLTLTQDTGKWWKGMTSGQWEMMAVQDSRTYATSKFDQGYINDLNFGFSKAKAFGVHTWMYSIDNNFEANYEYIFHWEKD